MDNPFLKEYTGDKNDKQLVSEAKEGNKQSLEQLLLKHQPFIYNVAWKMVRNPADAKDLTQEALIKIVTNLSKFQGKSKFSTWCYRIVMNHFLMSKRKSNEKIFTSFDTMADGLTATPDNEMSPIEKQEKSDLIKEMNYSCMSGMLLCLTRDQRLVYILGELFDADHTLGSEILNISKGNFRLKLLRARKDLYSFMNDKCGLVNKANPCRCHKKVKFVFENKILDSKNLLFNQKEYSNFRKAIKPNVDEMVEVIDTEYNKLYTNLPYNENFDKKTFLEDIVSNEQINRLMNLN